MKKFLTKTLESPKIGYLIIFTLFALTFTFGVFAFIAWFLLITGISTYEYLKKQKNKKNTKKDL